MIVFLNLGFGFVSIGRLLIFLIEGGVEGKSAGLKVDLLCKCTSFLWLRGSGPYGHLPIQ